MLNLMSFSPSNFGRYVSQTEQYLNEPNGINEWVQTTPPPSTSINDIPPIISIPTNVPQKISIASSIIKDDVEPLPFPQHGPGPIQRPNKLACPPTLSPSYLTNSIQSPGTPDVLDQLNRLLDNQNNPIATVQSTTNVNNSSIPINDLSTPNIPWTPFAPTEWSSKYDSSWPSTSIQSPTVSLTTQVQNPFALMSAINEQRQPTREELAVWSTALGTATPRLISSNARAQRATAWNDLFQSTVPSSTEPAKPTNNSWLKFWSAPDPSSADVTSSNGHEAETNNPFFNLSTLSNEPVVPPTILNPPQATSTTWWTNSSSDENNNISQTNHLNDDTTNNRDQSRWEFAR